MAPADRSGSGLVTSELGKRGPDNEAVPDARRVAETICSVGLVSVAGRCQA